MHKILNEIINKLESLPNYETTEMEPKIYDKKIIEKRVIEELTSHLKGKKISPLFIEQLIELYGNGYVTILCKKHPYDVFEIYTALEGILNGTIKERPFDNMESKLKGKDIFHAHHNQAFYINFNFISHFKNKYKTDDDVAIRLKQINKKYPVRSDAVSILVNEALHESINKNNKSGEWLVYQRFKLNYNFICLYLHDKNDFNDEKLYSTIEAYIEKQ